MRHGDTHKVRKLTHTVLCTAKATDLEIFSHNGKVAADEALNDLHLTSLSIRGLFGLTHGLRWLLPIPARSKKSIRAQKAEMPYQTRTMLN